MIIEGSKPYREMCIVDTTAIGGDFVLMEGTRIVEIGKVSVNKYITKHKEQILKLLILGPDNNSK